MNLLKKLSFCAAATALIPGWPSLGFELSRRDEVTHFECYERSFSNSPESIPSDHLGELTEKWCYVDFSPQSEFLRLIFNADSESIKPELSLLLHRDSTMAHGSLHRGNLTLHRTNYPGINPISVPLTPSREMKKIGASLVRWSDKINSTVNLLSNVAIDRNSPNLRLSEGEINESVAKTQLPRSVYWWPHREVPLAAGPDSPLGKYDAYIKARTGTDPKSSEWELANHSLQNVPWGGHCNGMAASVLLYKPVLNPLWDPRTKTVFLKSDVDGLYAEASFCVNTAFYGKRFYKEGDPIEDIDPVKFHTVLRYYIGNLKKPVLFDRFRNQIVDNHFFSGYKMKIRTDSENPQLFHVNASVTAHQYSKKRTENNPVAEAYIIHYQYDLLTNAEGELISGRWLSTNNPDFLWIPLSQAKCGRENPRLDTRKIEEIITQLKPATIQSIPFKFVLDRSLRAKEVVEVPIPGGVLPGLLTRVVAQMAAPTTGSRVFIQIEGHGNYPLLKDQSKKVISVFPEEYGPTLNVDNWLNRVSKISFVNFSDSSSPSTHFEIKGIEFLGGN